MPKITKVTVGFSDAVGIGGYSAIKPSIVFEAEVKDGEDVEAVTRELVAKARAQWEFMLYLRIGDHRALREAANAPLLDPFVYQLHANLHAKFTR